MKRCFVLFLLCCAACSTTPMEPTHTARVYPVGEQSVLLAGIHEVLAGALSPDLGYVEYRRAWEAVYTDGTTLLCIPVEAEDEIRLLVLRFVDGAWIDAGAFGFAQTTWFSDARAATAASYEGWLFCYGLADGARHIASYYEAGQLLQHDATFQPFGMQRDVVAQEDRFACLALSTAAPPSGITTRVFLLDGEERMRMLADAIRSLLACGT